jgi:hypothetical protein
MVALMIITVAGAWAVAMANQSAVAIHHVQEVEAETRRASGFLDAVMLWPRTDLDQHLGSHAEGPWVLIISRPLPDLYIAVLTTAPDTAHGQTDGRDLLHTAIYRPEADDAL